MRVLITGGAGFVGRHLVKRSLEEGFEVDCVDPIIPLTGGLELDKWFDFDPRDFSAFNFYKVDCREFFLANMNEKYDNVFHAAAMVGGRLMIEDFPLSVADDLSIDSHFWQWAVSSRPDNSICFSSSAAYPINLQTYDNYRLLKEDDIDLSGDIGMPDLSYGWAKLTHEYLSKLAYEKHGIKSVIFRPFSGYGEDQDLSYPFPSICKRVLEQKGSKSIKVWGSGYQMRDFIHIDDCIDGIFLMMGIMEPNDAVNLSTGKLTSFKEFASLASNLAGFNPEVSGTSSKPEGVFARGGDTTLQLEMKFKPKISFEDGIKRALDYFEKKI